ncbi:hypothetical protein PMAYCL1PPCAC_12852, partial [Pristionchus mayeri]
PPAKPAIRKSVSKLSPSPAAQHVPSLKGGRGRRAAPSASVSTLSLPYPIYRIQANNAAKGVPPPSGGRMSTGGQQPNSIVSPVGTQCLGVKSNYTTAIPRTPSRADSLMNMPSSKKKGG